jgi:hypothetical protein
MFGAPMRRGARTFFSGLAVALAVAGCGSGSPQNAKAPSGRFPVSVTAAFPASQRLAQHTHMVITVRNTGRKSIPNLAVTICNVTCTYPAPAGEGTSVAAFAQCAGGATGVTCLQSSQSQGLASRSRPVWVVEQPPGTCVGVGGYSCSNGGAGGDTAAEGNTWQRGSPLKPGGTSVFTWKVTAVQPGNFTVAWEISGDLYGNAKAVLSDGSIPRGTLPVTVSRVPAQTYVNDAGKIVKQQGLKTVGP